MLVWEKPHPCLPTAPREPCQLHSSPPPRPLLTDLPPPTCPLPNLPLQNASLIKSPPTQNSRHCMALGTKSKLLNVGSKPLCGGPQLASQLHPCAVLPASLCHPPVCTGPLHMLFPLPRNHSSPLHFSDLCPALAGEIVPSPLSQVSLLQALMGSAEHDEIKYLN